MSPAELERLRKIARRKAIEEGYAQLADDFGQEFMIKASKNTTQPLHFAWLDYLRQEKVNLRSPYYREISAVKMPDFSLDQSVGEKSEGVLLHDLIQAPEDSVPPPKRLSQFLKGFGNRLSPRQKTIMILIFGWGMEYQEVAEVLGLSKGRITHLLTDATEVLKKQYPKAKDRQTLLEE